MNHCLSEHFMGGPVFIIIVACHNSYNYNYVFITSINIENEQSKLGSIKNTHSWNRHNVLTIYEKVVVAYIKENILIRFCLNLYEYSLQK